MIRKYFQIPEIDRDSSQLPPTLPYNKLVGSRATTRSSAETVCSCSVCQIAGTFPKQDRAGVISSIFGTPVQQKEKIPPPSVSLQCTKCFTYVGQGKAHTCNKATKRANLEELVKSTSQKTKGLVTGSCIKAVFEDSGVSTRGGTASVPSGSSCPLKVTLGTEAAGLGETPKFSADNLIKLQTAFNFSDKTTL